MTLSPTTARLRRSRATLAWPDAHTHEAVRSRAVKAQLEAGWAARTCFAIDEAIGLATRGTSDPERLAALELKAQAAHAGVRASKALTPGTIERNCCVCCSVSGLARRRGGV